MKTTYLILGGNGAVGVQLVRHLLLNKPNVSLIAVGRHPEKPAAFTLYRGINDARIEYHTIDIAREPERLVDLCRAKKPSVIINTAAESESSASWKDSWRFFENNVIALAKIVEPLLREQGLKKWVQISSSEVYGSVHEPVTESTSLNPSTPYATSKLAADFYLLSLARVQDFPANIVRPPSIYGPGQQLHRIIPKTISSALLGRKLPLEGGGKTIKSFLHTDDLSRAVCLAAEQGSAGQIYNVGPGEGTSVRLLVEIIAEKLGVPFPKLVDLAPDRPGHDTQSLVDFTKITRELGWKPQVTLSDGLDTVIRWVQQHLDYLKDLPTQYVYPSLTA